MKYSQDVRELDIITVFDKATGKRINDSPMIIIKNLNSKELFHALDRKLNTRILYSDTWQIVRVGHIEDENMPFTLKSYESLASLIKFVPKETKKLD